MNVTFGQRLSDLAAERPEDVAVVFVSPSGEERLVSFGELDELARRLASALAGRGVGHDDRVVVGLPRSVEQLALGFAIWKLGAVLLPLRHDLPGAERRALLGIAEPAVTVATWDDEPGCVAPGELLAEAGAVSEPLPTGAPPPSVPLMVASGGSTGRPKLIRTPLPSTVTPGQPFNPVATLAGLEPGGVSYSGSPPYHFMGFGTYLTILEGGRAVILEKFDAGLLLDAVEKHRVQLLALVPTMMLRLLRADALQHRDLSSIQSVLHSAAPCPAWVKRGWIELVGAERVIEIYSSTEQVGFTVVNGKEWMERPGTVGRGVMTEIRIVGPEGEALAAGDTGEIFMRLAGLPGPIYEYVGDEKGLVDDEGFASVGDLGWLDDDGYLYLADRRTDLIITGGANVYPAEVEAVLTEHPAVYDAAVVGIPDEEWGKRVHAVVELSPEAAGLDPALLDEHCRARLAAYKVPRSYEIVDALPRNEAGKIRRSSLAGGNG